MRANTLQLFKFKALKSRLKLPQWQVIGLLESIWNFCCTNALDGDLSRYTADDLAIALEYGGDLKPALQALVETHWLDKTSSGGLKVHDWDDHCPDWVRKKRKRAEKTEDKPSVSEERRKTADSGGKCPPIKRSEALQSEAKRSEALPAREAPPKSRTPAEADASTLLAGRLAREIERASLHQPSAEQHDVRTSSIARRMAALGTDRVEAAVRWWIDIGRTEEPAQWGKIVRYPDALDPKGDCDRIEQALRRLGGDPDEEDREDYVPPTLTPEEVFEGQLENICRCHLATLERFIGQPGDRRMRSQLEAFCRKHSIAEGQRVLEHVMRQMADTPEVKQLAANPQLFTAQWLESHLGKAA